MADTWLEEYSKPTISHMIRIIFIMITLNLWGSSRYPTFANQLKNLQYSQRKSERHTKRIKRPKKIAPSYSS